LVSGVCDSVGIVVVEEEEMIDKVAAWLGR
jgi:hypothetical protein